MKHQVVDRLFLCSFALSVCAFSMRSDYTVSSWMIRTGGVAAELGVMALCCLAVLALLDTIVNDMLPDRFVFQTGVEWRQAIWLAIAVAFSSHAFVIVTQGLGIRTALIYLCCSARCAAVSFMDLHNEYADLRRDRRASDCGGAHG